MMEKRIHNVRAAEFYKLSREIDDDETLTFCYDLQ